MIWIRTRWIWIQEKREWIWIGIQDKKGGFGLGLGFGIRGARICTSLMRTGAHYAVTHINYIDTVLGTSYQEEQGYAPGDHWFCS